MSTHIIQFKQVQFINGETQNIQIIKNTKSGVHTICMLYYIIHIQ